MAEPSSAPAAVAAAVIVDELIRAGVRDAIVCPGSRSAPLARECARAEAEGRLRLHVRMDERGAAFLALGLAAATQRPTPVLTTSGTAVANLLPAMVEATYSGIPVLALTADRPAWFHGYGANQTIAQAHLFDDASVVTHDIDATAALSAGAQARLRATVDKLIAAMLQPGRGGAGHLNVRFDDPLVPDDDVLADTAPGRADGATWTDIQHLGQPPRRPVHTVDISRPTLVIAGDHAPDLPELAELPTIAEPSAPAVSNCPVHPLAAAALGSQSVPVPPQQIIVLGRPTLHRAVAQLLSRTDIDITVVTNGGLPGAADYADLGACAHRTVPQVQLVGEQPQQWLDQCEQLSLASVGVVRDAVADDSYGFTGLHAAAALTDSLRTGDTVVLGSSSAVRDCAYTGLPFPAVRVYSGRGAAGIDGTIATAIGMALASDRAHPDEIRPPRTIALMGDLTFLHDAGSLLIGPDDPRPENLTIVVANDNGGGIFEILEAGAEPLRSQFERVFGTPHDADISALCDAYGVAYSRASTLSEALQLLHPDTDVDGIRVVELRTSRTTRRSLHHELRHPGCAEPGHS
ncbi:2-succinyl-5-enolpyruvyl-6-hydroxy-3-cyclohexene-1-carboxylic-acid synthase [Corynebacterium sp. TAE3-ERU12]|uniref:2-succinyl-5-enolpyruvyl-6-hydroxy-3- cyclohexene-1-carboxylic-acid synthase n=1 Tax=Corynebacterium sp. TAE3-ERU12 TaxID=2849491 RepID=UPI001C481E66|nr:2-succinyl-5-enolpyruvyl-6-hydroxy-3-cyclohexene-1-carboxylic-acid synthase [Corynebacterium sp. TAE3-ERU12]MBV7294568.1 2-succinyl-5-enolpyruvyl-6-hydroxy-3-cyclohexene-1-carboxylic-acid synthase [Corynebacterium sp. TAE3-ERU12]